jgi:ssDNA-binding Zn-finger/Zn-ribbon topoisomerase 1
VVLRATGQVVLFDGFLRIYEEGRDDTVAEDDDKRLPQIMSGRAGRETRVTPEQHFTQPPPRYTEATLVKRMEELGIGRPSTYASIVTTIQDRGYVRKDKNRLFPEDKGRLVIAFLSNYFRRYVGYDFHRRSGKRARRGQRGRGRLARTCSTRFWRDFSAAIAETAELRITEVLEKINEVLEPHLFPPTEDGGDPRLCPNCGVGRLSMRTARSGGAFIGCSNYPECRYTRPFGPPGMEEASGIPPEGKLLGEDAGDKIYAFKGRFGPYVQRGEVTEDNKKPPRQSIPKAWTPEEVDLEQALKLLSLPARDRPPPRGRRDDLGQYRALWSLPQTCAEHFGPGRHQCQSRGCGRGVHHRDEPRGRGAGLETQARPSRGGSPLARSGRASRRRPGRGHEGPVRALREMGQDQRDPARQRRGRKRVARPGGVPAGRKGCKKGHAQAQVGLSAFRIVNLRCAIDMGRAWSIFGP